MEFLIDLSILANSKKDNYNSIFVIIKHLTKMIYYNLSKTSSNTLRISIVIMNIIIRSYYLIEFIITNKNFVLF